LEMASRLVLALMACAMPRESEALRGVTSLRQPGLNHHLRARPSLAPTPHRSSTPVLMSAISLRPGIGLLALRGGVSLPSLARPTTPEGMFTAIFGALSLLCAAIVFQSRDKLEQQGTVVEVKPAAVKSLQLRFLAVFWLFKMADWLQGPFFYEVYASKVINGLQVSTQGVARLFLTGFGSTALFGAIVGGLVDSFGRKRGSLFFTLMYALSALSTKCAQLPLLFAGRVAGGLGTSLLFSAPEAWLVSEHNRQNLDNKYLGQTFGLAYFGDAIVAIFAGLMAGAVAKRGGPTAPFELSVFFLVAGAALVFTTWSENFGGKKQNSAVAESGEPDSDDAARDPSARASTNGGNLVKEAVGALLKDKRIMLVGAVQAFFEGAMYIFVLQWPPAMIKALAGMQVPFGQIFSCFMVCCMIGSSTFSALSKKGITAEDTLTGMLFLATMSMASAAASSGGALVPLVVSFFFFEVCVGMYFPLIGTLRSKYLPDAYRGVIMNLFGIPLNLIVVAVFLSIGKLGLLGALICSTTSLSIALASQLALQVSLKRK